MDELPKPNFQSYFKTRFYFNKIILLPINFTKNEHETLRITGKNK